MVTLFDWHSNGEEFMVDLRNSGSVFMLYQMNYLLNKIA